MGSNRSRAEIAGNVIRYADVPLESYAGLHEQTYEGRIFNPRLDPEASGKLLNLRLRWKAEGRTVAFTSGVFDLFHQNHAALLLYSLLAAVPHHYDTHDAHREGLSWSDMTPQGKHAYMIHAVSGGLIKQIVSVDGDHHVAKRKNGNPTKGGIRPVYSWETRARDILLSSNVLNGTGPRFLVDAVTIHDSVHNGFSDTPHEGIMQVAAHVEPDVWSVHAESADIIEQLQTDTTGTFRNITPVVLTHRGPYEDPLVGDLSTSKVAARLGGHVMQAYHACD